MAGENSLLRTLTDKARPIAERVDAAERLGARPHASYHVWQALCTVLQDAREEADVRIAAAEALARSNRAAAPNQLCRALLGDDTRRVRAAAVRILASLGPLPATQQAALERDLAALQVDITPLPLANLAMSYGRDPRVLAMLQRALRHADPQIRAIAVRGLGAVGELREVLVALGDQDTQVRAAAGETVGYFGLRSADEMAALEQALHDAEPQVQHAARVALRRLGALPMPQPSAAAAAAPPVATSTHDWRPLLERWSRQWLSVREYAVELPDAVIASGWLGYAGASDADLLQAEERLGLTLPSSYRSFLRTTNGWRRTSPFIERIFSAAEVTYFRERHQEWIESWIGQGITVSEAEHQSASGRQDAAIFRAEYLQEAIQVSEVGDGAVYLLNPAIVTPEGEWEAWLLANWLPGARRYRSFWELLHAEYASFVELERPDG